MTRTIPLSSVYELDPEAAEASVLGAEGDAGMMQAAEAILRTHMPPADALHTGFQGYCGAATRTRNKILLKQVLRAPPHRSSQKSYCSSPKVDPMPRST
jgi:hypothetical protein